MALRCRRIVRKKRVRRLEPGAEVAEAANELHRTELHRTAQLLHDLRKRYDEKTRDLETARAKLEGRGDRLGHEQEKHQGGDDLMRLLCERLLRLEKDEKLCHQESRYLELQRRCEGAPYREHDVEGENARLGKKTPDEESIRQLELARSQDIKGFADRCEAMENYYRDQLRSVREAHEKEMRSLKDALQHASFAPEAVFVRTSVLSTEASLRRDSSAGEPCSEPSTMQSSRESRAGSGDGEEEVRSAALHSKAKLETEEALRASRRSIEQAATPQHFGLREKQRSTCDLEAGQCPAESSRKSTRWHPSVVEQKEYQDSKSVPSKVERVLVYLQRCLGQDVREVPAGAARAQAETSDTQPFEAVEEHLGQLCRLSVQGRVEQRHRAQTVELALKAAQHNGNSLKVRRDVSKILLEIGSKDAAMKEEMIAKGAIQLTVDTLQFLLSLFPASRRREKPPAAAVDVCSSSFRLLAVLCQRHRGQEPTAHDALDAVLHCLALPQLIDTDSSINGCYLIMTLVDKRPELQELVRMCDGIKLLIQLLDGEVTAMEESENASNCPDTTRIIEHASAKNCYYIAGCLAKVVQDNEKNQQALYKLGGINLLLRTLKTCIQSGEVVANACMAIAFTADQHEKMQHDARLQGAVELILDALLAYRGDSSVQIGVCRAIATLTERNNANQQAFLLARLPDGSADTGVVALLLQAFKNLNCKPDEEPLVTTMCWALSNLIVVNPDAMDNVRQLNGLEVMVSLLNGFAKEERACEYLCRLLAELVRGDSLAAYKNRQALCSLGAKEAILAMAQHHARSNGFVLLRVRDALQNLQA